MPWNFIIWVPVWGQCDGWEGSTAASHRQGGRLNPFLYGCGVCLSFLCWIVFQLRSKDKPLGKLTSRITQNECVPGILQSVPCLMLCAAQGRFWALGCTFWKLEGFYLILFHVLFKIFQVLPSFPKFFTIFCCVKTFQMAFMNIQGTCYVQWAFN